MKKILMVEDNESSRYLTSYLLEKSGFEVLEAVDGISGIELARKERPDLILMDIQLPGMDGHAVTRALRRDPAFEHTPIIAVTSYAMPADRERALSAGCNGYIEKPINTDTFVDEIKKFLPNNQASEDSDSQPEETDHE